MSKKIAIKVFFLSFVLSNLLFANSIKQIQSVTVTANKLEESILDIPQSITVIDKEELNAKSIDNTSKLIDEIPNMNTSSISGMGTFSNFRGINTSVFNIFSSPIVFYIDGIPTMNRYIYEASLVNAKRVEVLRGPQGTLYGKDSIGAVINVVTEDRPDEFNGIISIEYGSDKYTKTTFNISSPLIEKKLFVGLNGQYNSSDGFVTNHYNNNDKANKSWDYNINSYLKYFASDNLSLKFVLNKSKSKKNGSTSATYNTSLNTLSQAKPEDVESTNYEIPTSERTDTNSQSLALKYNFKKLDFDWISSHKDINFDGIYDYDFTNGNSFDNTSQYNNFNTESYSNELRLSSNKNKIKWLLGLYSDYEKFNESTGYNNYLFYGNYDASGQMKSKTNAIFGQTVIPLYKSLELTLGGRYQKVKKDVNIDVSIQNFSANNYNLDTSKTWNTFLPKVALSYKKDKNITPYLSISKGYMPGGFNTFPNSSNKKDNTFDPQKSIDYELGVKGIYDNFEFNTSIFYMDINDLQVYRVDSHTGAWNLNNAKKAHSYGLEVSGKYYLTYNFDLTGNLGLIKAVYDEYNAGNNNNFKGKNIENTPSHKANIALLYHDDEGLYGLFSIYNRGSISFYDNSTQKFLNDDSATTANIKIGHKFSNFDIYAYVNNITDKRYVTGYFSKGVLASVSYNSSRFVGIGIKYNF